MDPRKAECERCRARDAVYFSEPRIANSPASSRIGIFSVASLIQLRARFFARYDVTCFGADRTRHFAARRFDLFFGFFALQRRQRAGEHECQSA